jgi:1,4-dihydroxy-2-naphthoyl-CoA hydrolase
MALADAAGGWCAFLNLPDGATGPATVSSATNFLRAVTSGHVEAVARMLHGGRGTIVVDTEVRDTEVRDTEVRDAEVRDAAGRLAARVTQTQAVLR